MADFYQLFREALRAHGRDDLIPALDGQEAHRGSLSSVEALIVDAGLKLTRVVEDAFDLRWARGSAMFRHPLVRFFLDGWRGVVDDAAIYVDLEEQLNARGPVRQRIPMLHIEASR